MMVNIFKTEDQDKIDIPVQGDAAVQIAQFQGARPGQEDRLLVADDIQLDPARGRSFLKQCVKKAVEKGSVYHYQGSTIAAALVTSDGVLHTAGLGDSAVSVFVHDKASGNVTATLMTREHSLANTDEFNRIAPGGGTRNAGDKYTHGREGTIYWSSRYGPMLSYQDIVGDTHLLAVTRSVGDAAFKGVAGRLDVNRAHPEKSDLRSFDLNPCLQKGCDVYVEVDSDGLKLNKDSLGSLEEKRLYLQTQLAKNPAVNVAELMARNAIFEGSHDNCTAGVIKVSPSAALRNVMVVCADGHGGDSVSKLVIDTFEQSARRSRLSKPRSLRQPKP
jgi:serine/threonine protein phosphatase PrpC